MRQELKNRFYDIAKQLAKLEEEIQLEHEQEELCMCGACEGIIKVREIERTKMIPFTTLCPLCESETYFDILRSQLEEK